MRFRVTLSAGASAIQADCMPTLAKLPAFPLYYVTRLQIDARLKTSNNEFMTCIHGGESS